MVLAAPVLAAVVLAAPVLSLVFDEGAVPASSDVPPLPAGVSVVGEEIDCGSGGCWRELTLQGLEGRSPEERAARVGMPHETCRRAA